MKRTNKQAYKQTSRQTKNTTNENDPLYIVDLVRDVIFLAAKDMRHNNYSHRYDTIDKRNEVLVSDAVQIDQSYRNQQFLQVFKCTEL